MVRTSSHRQQLVALLEAFTHSERQPFVSKSHGTLGIYLTSEISRCFKIEISTVRPSDEK